MPPVNAPNKADATIDLPTNGQFEEECNGFENDDDQFEDSLKVIFEDTSFDMSPVTQNER